MKSIFIGSSTSAIPAAQRIASLLNGLPGVRAVPWFDTGVFPPGPPMIDSIERIAQDATGAIFVCTHDYKLPNGRLLPNPNVMIEYAYFLDRHGYDSVIIAKSGALQLPSDLAGITYVKIGSTKARNYTLPTAAANEIARWATKLRPKPASLPVMPSLHPYSGQWQVHSAYTIWHRQKIKAPDHVFFTGNVFLNIERSGKRGEGVVVGYVDAKVGKWEGKFHIADFVTQVNCNARGHLHMVCNCHSRELMRSKGKARDPSWKEQFVPGEDFDTKVKPNGRPGELEGSFGSPLQRNAKFAGHDFWIKKP